MKHLLILTLLFISVNLYSAEVVVKGEPAPFNGIIFTDSEEKQLRIKNEKLKSLEQLAVVYGQKDALNQERIKNYQDHIKSTQKLNTYGAVGYFLLGFCLASGSLYISSKVIKSAQ